MGIVLVGKLFLAWCINKQLCLNTFYVKFHHLQKELKKGLLYVLV